MIKFEKENLFYNFYKDKYSKIFSKDKFEIKEYLKKCYRYQNIDNIDLINEIELSGIRINNGITTTFYKNLFKNSLMKSIVIYPKYNITRNGRLYSAYEKFNCMAIPSGQPRKLIVSKFKNGTLFYFDYISLHPFLCLYLWEYFYNEEMKEINKKQDIYSQISTVLFDKNVDKNIMKSLFFKILYGNSLDERMYNLIEKSSFLQKIILLKDRICKKIKRDKEIRTVYDKRYEIDNDWHNGKIFANYMQTTEVDFVLGRLRELVMEDTKNIWSGFNLFMHDGILFDYNYKDDIGIIKTCINKLREGNDKIFADKFFPIHLLYGKNFQEVKERNLFSV